MPRQNHKNAKAVRLEGHFISRVSIFRDTGECLSSLILSAKMGFQLVPESGIIIIIWFVKAPYGRNFMGACDIFSDVLLPAEQIRPYLLVGRGGDIPFPPRASTPSPSASRSQRLDSYVLSKQNSWLRLWRWTGVSSRQYRRSVIQHSVGFAWQRVIYL